MRRFLLLFPPCAALGWDSGAGSALALTGTIASNHGESADVDIAAVFGWNSGGELLLYLSSDDAKTCASVVDHFGGGSPYDPADVLSAGLCTVFIFQASGHEGCFKATDADRRHRLPPHGPRVAGPPDRLPLRLLRRRWHGRRRRHRDE